MNNQAAISLVDVFGRHPMVCLVGLLVAGLLTGVYAWYLRKRARDRERHLCKAVEQSVLGRSATAADVHTKLPGPSVPARAAVSNARGGPTLSGEEGEAQP